MEQDDDKVASVLRELREMRAGDVVDDGRASGSRSSALDVDVDEQVVRFFLEEANGDVHAAVELVKQQINPQQSNAGRGNGSHASGDDGFAEQNTLRRRRRSVAESDERSPSTPNGSGRNRRGRRAQSRGVEAAVVAIFRAMGKLVSLSVRTISNVVTLVLRTAGAVLHIIVPESVSSFLGSFLASLFRGIAVVEPTEAAQRFIQQFQEEYVTTQPEAMMPNFQRCGHWEALSQSRRQCSFLVCYFHSRENRDAQRFCKETLADARVASFLTDNFTVWGGSVSESREAYRLSQVVRASRYPCLAVLVSSSIVHNFGGALLSNMRRSGSSSMALIASFEGFLPPEQIIEGLQKVLDDFGPMLVAARVEQQEREFDRHIREEQEAEYAKALEEDQRKDAEREAALALAEEEKRAVVEEQQRLEDKEKIVQDRRRAKSLEIPPEPEQGKDATTIVIRMPNGSRVERRFMKDVKLQLVYDFVDSLESNTVHEYVLISNFPRRVFEADTLPCSLEELGLHPQAALFLQSQD